MNHSQSDVLCQLCNRQYHDNNLPRILTMCGHTYCQLCISKMITNNISQQQADKGHPFIIKCPEDETKLKLTVNQLKSFPKNIALIKVIESKKAVVPFKQQSINLSKILKQQQNQEDQLTRELISTINQCKNQLNSQQINASKNDIQQKQFKDMQLMSGHPSPNQIQSKKSVQQIKEFYNMQQKNTQKDCQKNDIRAKDQQKKLQKSQQKEDDLCLLHQKPLQIICIIDKKKICSKCAIFGQHKGHQFKSIEEVQKQKNQCYMQILSIFKQKQQIEERLSNKQTQESLLQILNKKRDLLQKQVRQQFRKLRQEVTKQQKVLLRKIQQKNKQTAVKIKSLLKTNEKQSKDFLQRQVKSYQLLKALQSNELESKVEILYCKSSNTSLVVQNGNLILNRIKMQQSTLVNQVQMILQNLTLQKNKQIFELLSGFIQINDNIQKQRTTENSIKNNVVLPKNNQNIKNLTVSTLIIDNCKQKNASNSNCSIFEAFTNKNILQDEGSPLLQRSPMHEESLLDNQQIDSFLPSSSKNLEVKFETHEFKPVTHQFDGRKPLQPNHHLMNKQNQQDSMNCSFLRLQLESAKKTAYKRKSEQESDFSENGRNSLILTSRPSLISKKQPGQKPSKKKLKSIKISQKYQKIMEGIFNNTVDTIDLTNAEVGDQIMLQICQFVKFSKARTIKFIRNKLSDTGVQRILPSLGNAQILNLSQNNLTQNVLDIFIKHRYGYLSGLKNIILSQNKIIQRKHKAKIDQLRAMNIVVSV